MHLLITDSGVGGLSVCAYAERFLRMHGGNVPYKLTYVNASPENDFGYNSMGSRKEKLEYFDRFLDIISHRYVPDSIYIACNTLSVLYSDTRFSKSPHVSVHGIVETGANRLVRELREFPGSIVTIFGTSTTIEEKTYPRLLRENGIEEKRIISQACPSLADTISEDRKGVDAKRKIEKYVSASIVSPKAEFANHLTYLACTHYGYRKDLFTAAFRAIGVDTRVLNPNEFVINELFEKIGMNENNNEKESVVDIEFVTRYRIPETALETIAFFLDDISPKTVEAFRNYTHAPHLF